MISNWNQKLLLIGIFSYLLFYHIEKDEVHLMVVLSLIMGIISHILLGKDKLYEGFDDTVQFTEEEEESRRQDWLSETGDTSDTGATVGTGTDTGTDTDTDTDTGTNTDTAPAPSNTPFVTAEYVRLREEARKKDGPSGPIDVTENDDPEGGDTDEQEPSSTEAMFEENEEIKMTVSYDKFRMGPYDGLCISSDKFMENDIIDNDELVTYFGFQIPPQHVKTSQDVLKGPTVDGQKDSPQKLTMFANNKTSLNCCGESPYMTSTGCVCLTDNQRKFIQSRGFNTNGNDI
jgi:hypothetical protein